MKNKILKIITGVIFLILLFVILAIVFSPEEKKENIPNYTIISEENKSYSNVIRYVIKVRTSSNITHEEVKEIAKNITNYMKSKTKFNALSILLYSYEDNISLSPSIAIIDYAPYGDWSRADEVETGDYSKFEYNITYME